MKLKSFINKYSIEDYLVYLLGLSSTFQIVEIAGITPFTFLLIVLGLFWTLKCGKLVVWSKWFIMYFLSLFISLLVNIFTISENYLKNKNAWTQTSFKGTVLLVFLFFVYSYLCKKQSKRKLFFKGLYHSCIIQVVWSYMQYFIFHMIGVNINDVFFVKLLHMWDGVNQIKNGQMIVTGLHVNAGLLAPVLVFLFLYIKKLWLKLMIFGVFFISGSSTPLLCGVFLILLIMLEFIMKKKLKKKLLLNILGIFILVFFIVITNSYLMNRVLNNFELLQNKILSIIKRDDWFDGSTMVHTRYYTSIPFIINNIDLINAIFGFGIKCGGIPFVLYFNQYVDLVYGTESDFIANLYGIGILGSIIFYGMIFYIIFEGKKIDKKYFLWGMTIIFTGIFYSVQLNWVILIEWFMFWGIKNKISFEEIFNSK